MVDTVTALVLIFISVMILCSNYHTNSFLREVGFSLSQRYLVGLMVLTGGALLLFDLSCCHVPLVVLFVGFTCQIVIFVKKSAISPRFAPLVASLLMIPSIYY